jgi:hypothetical protein
MAVLGGGAAFHNSAIFHLCNPVGEGKNPAVVCDHDHAAVGGTGTLFEKFQSVVTGLGIK